jgi:hypothetical protein
VIFISLYCSFYMLIISFQSKTTSMTFCSFHLIPHFVAILDNDWVNNFFVIVATLYTTITKRCCIFHTFKKDVWVWFNMLSFHFILIYFVGTDQFSFRFNSNSIFFCGVIVAQCLVFSVAFCPFSFFFGRFIVCPCSITASEYNFVIIEQICYHL